jgi:hypothetical protein
MSVRPTILVDNNVLSRPELAGRVQGKTIYLSDAVMYELFGNGQWEWSIPGLAQLAPFADDVVGTTGLANLLGAELATGVPTQSIIGDPEVNRRLAPLLRGCRNEPSRAVDYFREGQPFARKERRSRMEHVTASRDLLSNAIDVLKGKFCQSDLSRCRTKAQLVPDLLRQLDIRPFAVEWLKLTATAAGYPQWDAKRMASTSCCWMRYLLSNLCLGVRLSVKPSLDKVSDDRLHSDHTDQEIVILATYADEFLTFDEGAAWLDEALRKCIQEEFWIPKEFDEPDRSPGK